MKTSGQHTFTEKNKPKPQVSQKASTKYSKKHSHSWEHKYTLDDSFREKFQGTDGLYTTASS